MAPPPFASLVIPLLLGEAHVSPQKNLCAHALPSAPQKTTTTLLSTQDRFLDLDAPDGVAGWFEPDWLAWLVGGCHMWKKIDGDCCGSCCCCCCAEAMPGCVWDCAAATLPELGSTLVFRLESPDPAPMGRLPETGMVYPRVRGEPGYPPPRLP